MLGDDDVWVGAQGAVGGKLECSWAECGQDAPINRDAAGVESVEVVDDGVVRLAVGGDRFGMADTDTEEESVAVASGNSVI